MSEFINIGIDLDTGLPVNEPAEKLASSNSIALGGTGTGKSTLWLIKLLQGFMALNAAAIFIFDGAQWPFMYHVVKLMAKASGRRFRAIFDNAWYDGERLDPFHQFANLPPAALDLARLLFNIAGIEYSKRYGPSWFGLASLKSALDAATAVIRKRTPITLQSILQAMNEQARHSRDAEQILYALTVLASFEALASDDGSTDFIRWAEVERERQVVFVSWDATSPASSFFATAVYQSLVTHAHLSTAAGTNDVQKIIVSDEWVTKLGIGSAQSLAMDRKHKLSHHLANQGRYQMDFVDTNLSKLVLDQMQYQLHMSPDAETQEYIQTASKTTGLILKGKTISNNGTSLSEREQLDRVLKINDILDVAHTFGAGILVRRTQQGFSEPVRLYLEHDMPESVFASLNSRPFPSARPKSAPTTVAPGRVKDDAWKAREAAVKALYEARLAWQMGG